MLRDDRMLREPFRFIAKEMEASLCTRESRFLSPYRAIENWLDRLVTASVLEKLRGGYGLTSGLARRFKELEESDRKKAERIKATLSQVTRILDRIPETERKQIKAEDWLRQPIQPFGISFAEAIDRDEKEYGDMARTLSQIERMIVSDGAIVMPIWVCRYPAFVVVRSSLGACDRKSVKGRGRKPNGSPVKTVVQYWRRSCSSNWAKKL